MADAKNTGHSMEGEHVYEDMHLPGVVSASNLDLIKEFDFDGDVVVACYPKSGTTWVQEIVWLLMNDGDTEAANSKETFLRIQFLDEFIQDESKSVPRPATYKSHLPQRFYLKQLLRGNVKFVISVRNPKDLLVSYFNFYKSLCCLGCFTGSWDEFFCIFTDKKLAYGDYFAWYESWWKYHDHPNVHFVRYEDLKKDLSGEVKKIAKFIGKDLRDDVINKIVSHVVFDAMKENDMTNWKTLPKDVFKYGISPLIREGRVGGWKEYSSKEQNDVVDKLYLYTLEEKGLTLEFE